MSPRSSRAQSGGGGPREARWRGRGMRSAQAAAMVGKVMRPTVHFDRELRFGAVEVEDVWSDGVLAANLQARETAMWELLPEDNLGQGHRTPRGPRGQDGLLRSAHALDALGAHVAPPPCCAWSPSPASGGGARRPRAVRPRSEAGPNDVVQRARKKDAGSQPYCFGKGAGARRPFWRSFRPLGTRPASRRGAGHRTDLRTRHAPPPSLIR